MLPIAFLSFPFSFWPLVHFFLPQKMKNQDLEAGRAAATKSKMEYWMTTLCLAFQSIGVVYGDLGTSPLYVYSSTFPDGIGHPDDLLGVLSLVIYTTLLIPFIKYAFIVLQANDNGEGGTFALYSLLCRHVKVSLMPNQHLEALSTDYQDTLSSQVKLANKIKGKMEKSRWAKVMLFLVTILATSMVIGDGVLTPCISVLSAVSGIKSLGKDAVVGISVAILIMLFYVQRFGTDKLGYSFAPIICLWFALLSGIGLYNLSTYGWGVLGAFNPFYIMDYFKRNGKHALLSLGGVVLCITGTEAMFADLGHFSVRAIQMSFSGVALPAIIISYSGQAAYLTKYPGDVGDTFYKSIPDPLYWPTFVVAVAAAIIGSQAMISGVFSIISQSLSLGCFPRVRVIHTSIKCQGQVYIPDINYILMIACVLVTISFKTTEKIGNAYGIAVVAVMMITTSMVTLIMLVVWKTELLWIFFFCLVFGTVEALYLSSVLYKFTQGGYLPIAFSLLVMSIMGIWQYVHIKRQSFELKNEVPDDLMKQLVEDSRINRVPGIGLLCSELAEGIPPIFAHYISTLPSIHSVLIFVSVKKLPINHVKLEDRFIFEHVEPKGNWMFRCVVSHGYQDVMASTSEEFENQLVENLKKFIHHEYSTLSAPQNCDEIKEESLSSVQEEEEMQFLDEAINEGILYLVGEVEVVAESNSSLIKKVIIDYVYDFVRKNFRQQEKVMVIPHNRLLRIGMTYEI